MTFWMRAAISSALVAFLFAFPVRFLESLEAEESHAKISCVGFDSQGRRVECSDSELLDQYGFALFLFDPWFWQRVATSWAALTTMCFAACALTQWRRRAP